jgi:hypothetical protein
MGATAVFSVMNAGLRPSLPVSGADQLVYLRNSDLPQNVPLFRRKDDFSVTVTFFQTTRSWVPDLVGTASFRLALAQRERVRENLIELARRRAEIFRVQVRIARGHAKVLVTQQLSHRVQVRSLHS